jgi:hypothetical protein
VGRIPLALDLGRIRELALEGHSCHEIALEFGVQDEAIRRRLVRMGISRLPAKARVEHNHFWRGGRIVDSDGYVLVHVPAHPHTNHSGYVREHRLVMEQHLGRYLSPEEVVDHRDNDPSNNALSNLRLFANNAEHLRATLTGRLDPSTEAGQARIRAGLQQPPRLKPASRSASEIYVQLSL